jgi:mono/diheme cytochrome c family protein/DNA-binding beta-propeller fold protein YncE
MRIASSTLLAIPLAAVALGACARVEPGSDGATPRTPVATLDAPRTALAPVAADGTGSTIVLAHQGRRRLALVADADAHAVRALDVQTGEELGRTDLPGTPGQLVIAGDGRVFVAVRDAGEVDELAPSPSADGFPMRIARRASTAGEPVGVALTADARTLLVTCGWGHALDAFSTRSLEHAWSADVAREPRAVVVDDDGVHAYVSHATASLVSVVDLESEGHGVRLVSMKQPGVFSGNADQQWRQGYALAKTDGGVLATGVLANTGDTTVLTETYGGAGFETMPSEQFTIATVDPRGGDVGRAGPGERFEASDVAQVVGAPSADNSCLLPRAMAYDPRGQLLFVACEGRGTLEREGFADGRWSFSTAAWSVGGEPTGIALDADRRTAFVWSQVERVVTAVPMDAYRVPGGAQDGSLVQTYPLGVGEIVGDATKDVGRALFHRAGDSRISSDGRACASCHPEGRDDGLVWATPDGPRQTPTLAGRLVGTAPYGWNGARDTVKKHVTSTVSRLGGTGLDDRELEALVDYCATMQPPPRAAEAKAKTAVVPATASATADPLVAEGRELFESPRTACASCHMDDGTYTDGNRHDVKSRAKGDPGRAFDTPSLRFVAGTAPYFHDARYPTLRALLAGSDGKMGHTKGLSAHEVDALEAYLRTL